MPPLVLLSCAAQDLKARDELIKLLTPLCNAGVLSLWYEAQPGQHAAQVWRKQRERAACLVALLSPDWLASPELVQGAQAARRESLPFIPILLRDCLWDVDGSPAQGLQLLPGGDWVAVARRLEKLIPGLPPRTSLRAVEDAAQHLDRTLQWRVMLARLDAPEHTLFFLYGHRHQRVAFFAARVRNHLESERPDRHLIVPVTFRDGRYCPRTSGEWEAALASSLSRALSAPGGDAAQLLRRAAREHPVFLLWGLKPLQQHLLEDAAEAGLRAFLAERLPQLLRKAAPRHPVRCLVQAEYSGEKSRAMVDRLRAAVDAAAAAGLPVCPLEEPRTPTWQDMADLLARYEPPPSPRRTAAIRRAFERLMADEADPDLNQIAALLEAAHRGPEDDDDDDDDDFEEDEP